MPNESTSRFSQQEQQQNAAPASPASRALKGFVRDVAAATGEIAATVAQLITLENGINGLRQSVGGSTIDATLLEPLTDQVRRIRARITNAHTGLTIATSALRDAGHLDPSPTELEIERSRSRENSADATGEQGQSEAGQ